MRVIVCAVLLASCSPRAALWTGAEGPSLSVAERALRATVALRDGEARWPQTANGCGVLIGRREILTVGHAVKNGGGLHVELHDGSKRWARVVRSLSGPGAAQGPLDGTVRLDLALLRLDEGEGGSSHWLPLASEDPPIGSLVLLVGAPEGIAGAITTGAVSRLRGVDGIAIGARVELGWSGGPVVSSRGELVGLVARGRESLTLAVPVSAIRAALKGLRR